MGSRCVAPVGEQRPPLEEQLCGRPAATTRTIEGIDCPLCEDHAAECDSDMERIERELVACRDAAREHGWSGEDADYEYTEADMDAVTDALGRKPTREEWRAAGLRWVGDRHESS